MSGAGSSAVAVALPGGEVSAPVSSFEGFLRELHAPVSAMFGDGSVLLDMLEADARKRESEDQAYLASLTDDERRRVLLQRRIESVERRYHDWWETNVAWRFRADPPDCEGDW